MKRIIKRIIRLCYKKEQMLCYVTLRGSKGGGGRGRVTDIIKMYSSLTYFYSDCISLRFVQGVSRVREDRI